MEEIDLKEFFNIFWKRKFIIILVTIIAGVIGYYYSYNYVVPRYKSSTTILLAQDNSGNEASEITQTDITLNQKLVSTYSELIKSSNVINKVLENLQLDSSLENDLKSNISVSAVSNTQVIKVTYTNKDAETACKVANEIASVFVEKVAEIYKINNVYVVDKAEVPSGPYNINHKKDIGMFAVGGAVFVCAIIFFFSLFDTTIKYPSDVEANTGLNVIAQIPEIKKGGKK